MTGLVLEERYEVCHRLGIGGMATVYLAHDRRLDRQVALKVLNPALADNKILIERFRREAASAGRLHHPNIVQIYDWGEGEDTYYIAMERVEGLTLKALIEQRAPLPPSEIVALTSQILAALQFAHRRGLVHRDIKPQNVLVDHWGQVKVTDFGIARAASVARLTETGSLVGTVQYVSPEQASGGAVDAASDLYSLGVVMFEMATGQLPFTADNPVAIALRHLRDEPPAPRSLNPTVPEDLERVILRALQKDPGARYPTAAAFLEDLALLAAGKKLQGPAGLAVAAGQGGDSPGEETPTKVMREGLGAAADRQWGDTVVRRGPPPGARRRGPVAALAGARLQDTAAMPQPAPALPSSGKRRAARIWPRMLVLPLFLFLGLFAFLLLTQILGEARLLPGGAQVSGDTAGMIQVPELSGNDVEEAGRRLAAAGLRASGPGGFEPVDEGDEGTVIRQEPKPGETARPGSAAAFWLAAAGAERVEIPGVTGLTKGQAVALLGRRGFRIDVEGGQGSAAAGVVLEQQPAGGEQASVGSTVLLLVAGPQKVVEMPLIVGQNERRAVEILQERGLVVRVRERVDSSLASTVLAQDPEAGVPLEEGDTVLITVAVAASG